MRISPRSVIVPVSLAVAALTASCVPEFENPPPPVEPLRPDPELLGTWASTDESGERDQISFFPRGSGWIDVVLVSDIGGQTPGDGVSLSVFEGYSAEVGDEKFLCLRERGADVDDETTRETGLRFLLAHYFIADGRSLHLALFSDRKVQAMVDAGELSAGPVTRGQEEREVITSSSADLVALIRSHGAAAFIDEEDLTQGFSKVDG
jgi:hypothetical protein